MNRPARMRFFGAILIPLLLALGTLQAEENGTAKTPRRGAVLLPSRLLIGAHLGCTASRFMATKDYAALIEPAPAKRDIRFSASYGLLATARWRGGITLTFAPRYERYRVDTREETVSFPDNPFPHTLKASSEFSYNLWPFLLGYGWFAPDQHAQIQAGPYAAFLDGSRIEWTVDDQPYANRPNPQIRDTESGWIAALEYGRRIGPGELLLGAEAQRQNHSMLGGLNGSAKAASARVSAAYAFTVMRR